MYLQAETDKIRAPMEFRTTQVTYVLITLSIWTKLDWKLAKNFKLGFN